MENSQENGETYKSHEEMWYISQGWPGWYLPLKKKAGINFQKVCIVKWTVKTYSKMSSSGFTLHMSFNNVGRLNNMLNEKLNDTKEAACFTRKQWLFSS
jgi:hypothetical protein